MAEKRIFCGNWILNINYLINTIHLQAPLVISIAEPPGKVVKKRDSANLSCFDGIYFPLDTL
jgi:hypothetical protein